MLTMEAETPTRPERFFARAQDLAVLIVASRDALNVEDLDEDVATLLATAGYASDEYDLISDLLTRARAGDPAVAETLGYYLNAMRQAAYVLGVAVGLRSSENA